MSESSSLHSLSSIEQRIEKLESKLCNAKRKTTVKIPFTDTYLNTVVKVNTKCNSAESEHVKNFLTLHSEVEEWLKVHKVEDEFLYSEAKAEIIGSSEDSITEITKLLEQVQKLEQYIDPPALKNLPELTKKLAPLEKEQLDQIEAVTVFSQRVDNLVTSYNSIISQINATFLAYEYKLQLWESLVDVLEKDKK